MNQGMILIKITLSIGDEEFELDLRGTPDENGLLKDSETRDFSINSIFMDVDNNGKSTFFFVKNVVISFYFFIFKISLFYILFSISYLIN